MTAPARDRLHELVDQLPENELADALTTLEARLSARKLPGFVGMVHTGRGDLSERVKEVYREGIAHDRNRE